MKEKIRELRDKRLSYQKILSIIISEEEMRVQTRIVVLM